MCCEIKYILLYGAQRSSLNDSKLAMKFQQNYPKALSRAASCSYHIKNYDQCIEFCNKYIGENGPSAEISRLMTSAISEQVEKYLLSLLKFFANLNLFFLETKKSN